ncbi:hypothetical protein MTR67_007117 [Solanum verrucosum]|uniref:Uncharacterized protein n=1 Tax=Solanum verrucosum TaxID=315347 RepID=A0AAF0TAB0_SOLVR|nr:hypothetical protein MTR67_007117 [Solanum verrucosum]
MARANVPAKNQPPRKRARGTVLNEEVAASWALATNLLPKVGKDNGKRSVKSKHTEGSSNSDGVYATHLTTSWNEGHFEGSSLASVSEPKDD